ncbi:MAG: AAA family ATPase [Sutterellaceae bacterium]|nr:AAA family ATPase [Sutterellaceae bacterium]
MKKLGTTVFERKVYQEILNWKDAWAPHYALFLHGADGVGKAALAEKLGRETYRSYMVIDFARIDAEVRKLFVNGLRDLDMLFATLQFVYGTGLYPGERLIVLDDVQYCSQARQALKTLLEDGRFHYIETGMTAAYEKRQDFLIPSKEMKLDVLPLDFEEFLWTMGDTATVPLLREHWARQKATGASSASAHFSGVSTVLAHRGYAAGGRRVCRNPAFG